jgi:short-subunit dehydrogenase
MIARGLGGIVLVSSMAGFQGTALVAHYAATKSYQRVLAEGLWEEFGPAGVDVLAIAAGPTDTPGYRASRPARAGRFEFPPVQSPADVVANTLNALGRGPVYVPSTIGRITTFLMRRLLPTRTAIRIISNTTRKMYARPALKE